MNFQEIGPVLFGLCLATLIASVIFRWSLARASRNGAKPLVLNEKQTSKWLVQRGTWAVSGIDRNNKDKLILKDSMPVRIFSFVTGLGLLVASVYFTWVVAPLLLDPLAWPIPFILGTWLATGVIGFALLGLRAAIHAIRYEITQKDGVLTAQYALRKATKRISELQSVQLVGGGSAPLGGGNVWRMSLQFRTGDPMQTYIYSPGFVDLFFAVEAAKPEAFETGQVKAMKAAIDRAKTSGDGE